MKFFKNKKLILIGIVIVILIIIACGIFGYNKWKELEKDKKFKNKMPKQEYTLIISMDNILEINFSKDYEIKNIGIIKDVERNYYEEKILSIEMEDLNTTVEKIFEYAEENNKSNKKRKLYTDCFELKKKFKKEKVELVETSKINKIIQEISKNKSK